MKTIILGLSILFFTTTISIAQTKKIALRSHSGANSTFTIFVPDDFGLPRIDLPVERDIKVKKTSKKNKKVDSLAQCTPENSSMIVKDTGNIEKNKVLKEIPKNKTNKKTTRSSKPMAKKLNTRKRLKRTKKQHQVVEEIPVAPKKSSLPLLALLLTISAFLSFILHIKKL